MYGGNVFWHKTRTPDEVKEPRTAKTTNYQMKLVVVLLDTCGTYISAVHENQTRPYKKRHVVIEFTQEQLEQLKPRRTGFANGSDWYEEIGDVWIEEEEEKK